MLAYNRRKRAILRSRRRGVLLNQRSWLTAQDMFKFEQGRPFDPASYARHLEKTLRNTLASLMGPPQETGDPLSVSAGLTLTDPEEGEPLIRQLTGYEAYLLHRIFPELH